MLNFLTKKQTREEYLRTVLGAFASENKECLIIVADPKTDYLFVAYKNKMVLGQIKSLDGEPMSVVHGVLRQSIMKSKFDAAIDRFTGGLVDVLKLGLREGNQFYSFISDVLFAFQDRSKAWSEARSKRDAILQESKQTVS